MLALLHAVTAGAALYIKQENLIAGKPEYTLSNYHTCILALLLGFHPITPEQSAFLIKEIFCPLSR